MATSEEHTESGEPAEAGGASSLRPAALPFSEDAVPVPGTSSDSGGGSLPAGEDEDAEPKKKKKKKGKLGTERGIETMFRTSYRTHMDLSALADTKANIMISINGLIISILIASISPKIDANPWLLIPTAIFLLCCLVSIIYAVLAARPRVTSDMISLEDVRARRANILFFGHFVNLSRDDYVAAMTDLMQDTDELYQSMIRDIYGLGLVLQRKFALLRISYNAFMVGLIAGILSFLVIFTWVVLGTGGTALP